MWGGISSGWHFGPRGSRAVIVAGIEADGKCKMDSYHFQLQWTLEHEGVNDLQLVKEESTPYKAIDKISSSHKCGRKCTG